MLSTIGTARGTTQGSWRPRARSCSSTPSRVTVFCFLAMVEVGLNATLKTMSSPLEMPPWMPPERLVRVRMLPSGSSVNSSLCSMPVMDTPLKPEPISKPLVAGRLIIALASSASSLSKTGCPRPRGTRRATHVTVPPVELPFLRTPSIAATICSAISGSGQRAMLDSTCSMVTVDGSTSHSTSFTWLTQPTISTPKALRSALATAPAATRPMVSRALERPPPAAARTPYLKSYVASACDGRYATTTSL
mmetsp:Transcript_7907/g.32097  ORF Transcript_7907/g.32097 Transcript_7907/m.32097 type:complete len:249 (+) Transcript_7907:295-1041(+)